jgi:hypothetical protein
VTLSLFLSPSSLFLLILSVYASPSPNYFAKDWKCLSLLFTQTFIPIFLFFNFVQYFFSSTKITKKYFFLIPDLFKLPRFNINTLFKPNIGPGLMHFHAKSISNCNRNLKLYVFTFGRLPQKNACDSDSRCTYLEFLGLHDTTQKHPICVASPKEPKVI